jgi:branched-chain amino acid aminotransferase
MTMTEPLWLNGALVPGSDARLDPLAHGFLFGAGVYDSVPLKNGVPVALERHLNRLTVGAVRLGLPAPDATVVRNAITALSTARGLRNARIRIMIGAGPSKSVQPAAEGHITLITLAPLPAFKSSIALTIPFWRRNEFSPLAGIKFTACAENLLAQRAALDAGFDEALFLNGIGLVCEGAFSNVFLVREGTVITPSLESGCLPGITREIVMELCRAHSFPCAEENIPRVDLLSADEMFVTSSIRGVQPVHRLDDHRFPVPGPVTARLRDLYAAWLEDAAPP